MSQEFQTRQTQFENGLAVGSPVVVRFPYDGKTLIAQAYITHCDTNSFEVRLDADFQLRFAELGMSAGHWIVVPRLGTPQHRVEPLTGY